MAQTLAGYITEVRRLLHDANANFYSDAQLTDCINQARERVVRDTGCQRTIQIFTTPTAPVLGGAVPYIWTASTAVATGDYVFSNIFIYKVVAGGITGTTSPPYPSGSSPYPPATTFLDGTATLQYAGPCEVINWAAMPQGVSTLDILNVNLFWGNTRIPLRYMPWTQFNAMLRFWQNTINRPTHFSIYGQQQIFLGPVPDQVYTVEVDSVVLPATMQDSSDTDTINDPYTAPVPFYGAYLAKYYEQSYGEAEIFKQEYLNHVRSVLASVFTRRISDPYNTGY